jgi:hypothetical protein
MNLNLGMRAVNSFFQEQDAQKLRDQQQRRFEAENKRTESELSMLADKAEADRTDYLMRSARNRSGMELQPSRQRVEQGRLTEEEQGQQFRETMRPSIESYERNKTEAALARQPVELQTAGLNAQSEQSKARINQADATVAEESIPNRMTQGRQKQAVDDYSHHTQTVTSLAQAITSGDAESTLKLMNGLNEAKPEGQRVKPAVRLGTINGGKTLVALDADGNQTGGPLDIGQMQQMASQGQAVKLKAGETIGTFGKGGFTPSYTAPDPTGSATKQGPLQRDVEYLKNYHGMTNEQALAHLSAAKTMTRDQFILAAIKEKASKGFEQPTRKDAEEFGALYDSVQNSGKPSQQPTQQPAQAPKGGFNWREYSSQ